MYSFLDDYSEGAHPRILNALLDTNMEQSEGYGLDKYTSEAKGLIKQKIGRDNIEVHFIPGGTQTNLIAISAFLRPHEAVISSGSGHIEVHETGAIESTGHKIILVDAPDGKLSPTLIQPVLTAHTDEHMVKPRLVYISDTTELGTVYYKNELAALSAFCRQNRLLLYLDGARLGSALISSKMSLGDIAHLTDAFYIGGTKNGALLGEALVICNDALKEDMRFIIKQKGALLAKGRVLGLQFYELFRDDLFFQLARCANETADIMRRFLATQGFPFLSESPSNQIFPIFPNKLIETLCEEYLFHVWCRVDANNSCIRLVTSWATPREAVAAFTKSINKLLHSGD